MEPLTIVLSIAGGFLGLILGGELLVRGASKLAAALNVPPLIIGLTVVALGTSAPELAVSVQSCFAGKTDLAVGNVVGSNLSNLLLILGSAALVGPLAVSAQLFRLDIPVMIASAAALFFLGMDGEISRGEGFTLALAMVLYLGWTVREGRREAKTLEAELEEQIPQDVRPSAPMFVLNVVLLVAGLAMLIVGSDFLVDGCVELAKRAGVSELVIGLTVVAIGTSLPELVISVVAALRGKRDLAVGNVVGSNILNVLAVVGISASVAPAGAVVKVTEDSIAFHIPLMVLVSVACYPVFLTGKEVTRTEGIGMVAYFAAYIAWVAYLAATGSGEPGIASLVGFLAPLAVAMVCLAVFRRPAAE